MPLLRGLTLDRRLKQGAPLPPAEVLRIGREIADGIEAAHNHGLIHRDIKPGNIWLEEGSGRVKILDFGLARVVNEASQLTQDGIVVGTPAFMAPERARGREDFDGRGDLFSLGGILYRMVTGNLPFPADHTTAMLLSLLSDDPIPPRTVNPAIPPALEALILRLLAKDPAARPQTARLVVEAWRHRTADLMAAPGIEQVFCFENRGEEIGVTLTHPHGQIYGYPFLAPRAAEMLRQARAHRSRHGSNLFADLLVRALADGGLLARAEQGYFGGRDLGLRGLNLRLACQ